MSTEGSHLISFQHWDIGERKIRYICIGDNDDFCLKMTSFGEKRLIPLFLGADVYSDTDIRVGNHPRYHAKFAKKGLATKLVFPPEYRFHGLRVTCGMNSLWFYSIQGIFRVAFELYSKQEQLSVLETLQELLKSRLNDDPLKMTYQLTKRLDNPESHSETTDTSHLHTEVIMDNPVGEQACISQETDPDESASLELPEDTSSDDHDYCSSVKTATCETFSQACKISQTLQNLESQLQTIAIVESQQKQILSSCLRLLECCSNSLTDDEEQLAKAVLALLQLRTPSALSTYCSPLLQVVAGWLGQCFHAANSCISQQVEGFKVRHIEHISDLPPAEELAAELFPEAMRTLLVNWMGLGEEAAPWKRHSEFPILLLILEFANHNLITGVAHVLYSSLICK